MHCDALWCTVMQSQSGGLSMQLCDVQYTMYNTQCAMCTIYFVPVMQCDAVSKQRPVNAIVWCALRNVQSVQYTMCNCAVCDAVSKRRPTDAMCDVQYTMWCNLRCTYLQCVTQNVQCAMCDVQRTMSILYCGAGKVLLLCNAKYSKWGSSLHAFRNQESSIPISTYSRAKPTVLQCSWYFWLPSRKFTFLVLCFDEVASTSGT